MSRGKMWWIIHVLKLFSCGLIIFTVVTDQHSAAISVQVVDDVGYSLEEKGFLACFIVEGTLTVFLIFQNFSLCVVYLKEKKMISENWKK